MTTALALTGALAFVSAPRALADADEDCVLYEITAIVVGPECNDIIGGPADLSPYDMNDAGHIVGHFCCTVTALDKAFVWYGEGGITPIPVPPEASEAIAYGINNHGVVVGRVSGVPPYSQQGFRYDGETFELLPMPEGAVDLNALAINDAGDIVGHYGVADPPYTHAFLLRDGVFIDLGSELANVPARALTLNNNGQIGGRFAPGYPANSTKIGFVWGPDGFTNLGPIPDGTRSVVKGLNDAGMAVGDGRRDGPDCRAFAWQDGVWQVLEPFDGQQQTGASSVSATGVVYGAVATPAAARAVIWRHGQPFLLEDLLASPTSIHLSAIFGSAAGGDLLVAGRRPNLVDVVVIVSPAGTVIGDLDGDCSVGVPDLLRLFLVWQTDASDEDLDGNGLVGFEDLLILLAHWG